ncbi:MAG: endopeptidase La [Campylobacteraceae bacterium]|nr:endopeptidase La [Campylobacteraceae bacterium]
MQLSTYNTFPTELPIIAEDEIFLYPFMITQLFLSDKENIDAANEALEKNNLVLVCPVKAGDEGGRSFESIYDCGVIGSIMRKVVLSDGKVKILFQGMTKGRIVKPSQNRPLKGVVEALHIKQSDSLKIDALLSVLREKMQAYASTNSSIAPDFLKSINQTNDAGRICDLIAHEIKPKKELAYKLFIESDLENKILMLIDFIMEETQAFKLQKEIKSKVHSRIEKVNKEYFLKEQLKQIQQELGADNQKEEELERYKTKLEIKKPFMEEDAYKEIKKQIERLSKIHPDSADANLLQGYLDWVIEMPFEKSAKKRLNISEVKKQLDNDHYSLEKPKERIIEYFAVKELLDRRGIKDKESRGAILCFAGPPGVGKTSLANSISKALKRKLIRIALGGLEDVNELRGHRRTYIGAMPGRIAQGLIEAGQMNPVIVLDEIDKVARSFRGDPTAVLLEILDPEQNNKFRDYYLNFNVDLSDIVFIATANDVSSIPAPLRDRMEFIFLSSYTPQEKYEIAKKYLIPQEMRKHGLKNIEVTFAKNAVLTMIENYTRESGVRNLRRRIADILRKSAKQLLINANMGKISITSANIKDYLEKTIFEIEEADKKDFVGQVNGLAWTSVGGDVLKVEAVRIQGKGNMQLTGSLGDVMKESAKIAQSVVKVLIDEKKLKINKRDIPLTEQEKSDKLIPEESEIYRRFDLHLHVPEGATPKDGPSAGITMATAIASILSNIKVRSDTAMTGELTLRGKVLPIGGLKEKLIAAYKAKIKTVIIPKKNYERDLNEVPDEVKNNMQILSVSRIEEVLDIALAK